MIPVEERVVLVTGASGGVGSLLVADLALHGFKNVACQWHSDQAAVDAIVARALPDLDAGHFFRADLTSALRVSQLREDVTKRFGRPWGIINLAGQSENAMSWKMSSNAFMQVVESNLLTTFLTCREFVPGMREQLGGRVINASSVVASAGAAGASAYCAAKAGIEGLTRAMALELAPKEITVNAVAIGYLDAGMISQVSPELQADVRARTPLKRLGHVCEVAGLVRYLLSDEGAFTTGQVLHVNGGYRL